jgi:hypothetical protein
VDVLLWMLSPSPLRCTHQRPLYCLRLKVLLSRAKDNGSCVVHHFLFWAFLTFFESLASLHARLPLHLHLTLYLLLPLPLSPRRTLVLCKVCLPNASLPVEQEIHAAAADHLGG